MTVKIASSRFGAVEVPEEEIVSFPRGLIGIGGSRYALLAREADDAFVWLHSLDDPTFALPVCDPWSFFGDYEVVLTDADEARLGLVRGEDAQVWVTVRAGETLGDFTANLRAPILVVGGVGHQVINDAENAPVRAPLFDEAAEAAAA
jgi:flagellar assembly factor FliW